jgi:hypothetical protein
MKACSLISLLAPENSVFASKSSVFAAEKIPDPAQGNFAESPRNPLQFRKKIGQKRPCGPPGQKISLRSGNSPPRRYPPLCRGMRPHARVAVAPAIRQTGMIR